ncbi:hypothetical protein ACN4EI_08120 [Corynebacterium amycolatum]|uniref:hypothetical protein n=1 Tax=Corynebacterium amycolatum TaxID=43765 RepID=UPI003AF8A371
MKSTTMLSGGLIGGRHHAERFGDLADYAVKRADVFGNAVGFRVRKELWVVEMMREN